MVDVGVGVQRRRRDAQALGALGDRRIVDRLHVDAVAVEQDVADPLALDRIAHHHRHDVALVRHVGNADRVEPLAHLADVGLVPVALGLAGLQMADRRRRAGRHVGRQRGGEDEAGRERADEVAERGGGGDVAADHAERLAERALDDREAVHQAFALGDAAAARAVEANSMHLVQIGHGAVGVGHVAEFLDRRDVAVHRVDGLEGDQLRPARLDQRQPAIEILGAVVLEDLPLGAAVADALDHRRVVLLVGEHHAAGELGGERREAGPVRNVAGGEQQRRFLAVQVGKLALQQHVVVVRSGDVAGAAGACAAALDRLVHCLQHGGVLAHAEIVVRAPDRDFRGSFAVVARGAGEAAAVPLQIGEHAVVSFTHQGAELVPEEAFVIHHHLDRSSPRIGTGPASSRVER